MTGLYRQRSLGSTLRDGQIDRPLLPWRARLLQIGFLAFLALTGWLLWLAVDLGFYIRQQVKITHIGTYCFLHYSGRHRPLFPRSLPKPTEDCDGLRNLQRNDPSLYRYRVVSDTFVTFTYLSPADEAPHPGMLRRSQNDTGQPARAGNEIVVYASRLFAATYTDWSSANAPN